MMKKATLLLVVLMTVGAVPLALADERPEHYEGKPAETLEQAVTNFREYNNRLNEILARENLSPADLNKVHQLTYTLENALARINSEFGNLADTLEDIHIASERADTETVKNKGRVYLETAGKVIQ